MPHLEFFLAYTCVWTSLGWFLLQTLWKEMKGIYSLVFLPLLVLKLVSQTLPPNFCKRSKVNDARLSQGCVLTMVILNLVIHSLLFTDSWTCGNEFQGDNSLGGLGKQRISGLFSHKSLWKRLVTMAHTCNPSYLGGWDQVNHGLRPVGESSSQDPIPKISRENGLEV
jgi:hypothetical protein